MDQSISSDAAPRLATASESSNRTRFVLLLCLPSILCTAFFLIGEVLARLHLFGDAPPIVFRAPTGVDHLKEAIGLIFFLVVYFGAELGPLLLPVAFYQAVCVSRETGPRSAAAVRAWVIVALGISAAALFLGWLIRLDISV